MDDPSDALPCPGCGITLEREAGGPGFALVSAAPDSLPAAEAFDPTAPPQGDPILADHGQWKVGAIFAGLLGLALLIVAGLSAVGDYATYGPDFFRKAGNRFFLLAVTLTGTLLALGGALIFVLVERESRFYLDSFKRRALEAAKSERNNP